MNVLSKGTKLKIDNTGFQTITKVMEMAVSGVSWDEEETTDLSDSSNRKEFSPTIADETTFSLTIFYDPANAEHVLIKNLANDADGVGTEKNFQIEYPGQVGEFEFTGFVKNFQFLTPPNEKTKASFEVRVSGLVVDTIQPVVESLTFTDGEAGIYVTTETIQMTVAFDEVLTITGTPQITINLGSGNVLANFVSGSGTHQLVFEYVVQAPDSATAGQFDVATNALALNGGTIQDGSGNNAVLTLPATDTSTFTVN